MKRMIIALLLLNSSTVKPTDVTVDTLYKSYNSPKCNTVSGSFWGSVSGCSCINSTLRCTCVQPLKNGKRGKRGVAACSIKLTKEHMNVENINGKLTEKKMNVENIKDKRTPKS